MVSWKTFLYCKKVLLVGGLSVQDKDVTIKKFVSIAWGVQFCRNSKIYFMAPFHDKRELFP